MLCVRGAGRSARIMITVLIVSHCVTFFFHHFCFCSRKDMAGLLKPRSAPLLVEAIRSVTDLPIHFHTHATSSCSLATALEMARAGCDVSVVFSCRYKHVLR